MDRSESLILPSLVAFMCSAVFVTTVVVRKQSRRSKVDVGTFPSVVRVRPSGVKFDETLNKSEILRKRKRFFSNSLSLSYERTEPLMITQVRD